MQYLLAALLVAVLYGFQIVGEKLFMEDLTVSNSTLVFLTTGFLAIFAIALVPFTPINLTPTRTVLGLFILMGGLYTLSMVLWFYAMERENASKVGQLASLEAISTSIAGFLFFNESPDKLALFAIGLVILGIFTLVFDRGVARAIVTTKVAVIPMIVCVLLWSAQDSLINYITMQTSFWTAFFWIRTLSFAFFAVLITRKTVRDELRNIIFKKHSNFAGVFWSAKFASAIALVGSIYAISKGPLSIVAPVLASYPIFALIIGLIATRYTDITIERFDNTHITKRATSLVLYTSGVVILFTT